MVRKVTILSGILLLISFSLSSQQMCGTDERHHERMRDPVQREAYYNMNAHIRSSAAMRQNARTLGSSTIYTIPVVFHVMHRGEPYGHDVNLLDEKIYAALRQLNERFRKVPGSVGDGNSVDMQIQFALAVRDPNGNATYGINRVDMTGYPDYMQYGMNNPGMSEADVKAVSYWDSHYYLNVWVVAEANGYGGFAHYASAHGQPWDGIVASPAMMNGPNYAGLTHEFGHYFNLIHVFGQGDGLTCSPETDCTVDGDMVCDTPPQVLYAPCELSPNVCVPGEDLAAVNYMSYSCMEEFTEGQKSRAHDAVMIRASLLEENGNMALIPVEIPAPDFSFAKQGECNSVGSQVQFLDRSFGIPNTLNNLWQSPEVSFDWTVTDNDGTTLTSSDQHPTFIIPVEGSYDVTLTVTNALGTSSVTKYDFLTVQGELPQAPSCIPFTDGSTDYPFRTDDIGLREVILNDMHHFSGTSVEDAAAGLTDMRGYGDFSCSQVATLESGMQYTVSVVVSESTTEKVHVFIDFDNNGLDNDDLVTYSHSIPAASGIFELPAFTIPAFAVGNTPLRMRVIDAAGTEFAPEACGFLGYYGQIHDYTVIVLGVNIPPVANDDAVTTDEDTPVLISVAANDTDADGTIVYSVDLDPFTPAHVLYVVTPEGNWDYVSANRVTFTPVPNFNGVATIQYSILDNSFTESLPATITVTVNPVNDAPSFVTGADEMIMEGSGAQTINNWATSMAAGPADESSQGLTFTVINSDNAMFSVQPSLDVNGNLSYTPAPDASGIITVTATLSDDGGIVSGGVNSSTQSFTITINDINDSPSFTKGTDQTVNEDAGVHLVHEWATSRSAGPASESSQVLTFYVTNDNNALFSVQPSINSSGDLSFTTALNVTGSAIVNVVLNDNGGTLNGGVDTYSTQTFTITVNPVNDPPSFVKGADEIVSEDAGAQLIANWATLISAGPLDESGQELGLTVTNDNTSLFSSQPAIDLSGNLKYTPAENAFGSATVTIVLKDNGGTINGGEDTFVQTFTIIINAVNDAPVMAINNGLSLPRGGSQIIQNNLLRVTDIDNADAEILFTLVNLPVNGTLLKNDVTLSSSGSFSQTDIDQNRIAYQHNGQATPTDEFSFTVSDGQGGTIPVTSFQVAIDLITGIESNQYADAKVYPVPASKDVHLILTNSYRGIVNYQVVDFFGRQLMAKTILKDGFELNYSIDVSELSAGGYVLQVSMGNQVRLFKIQTKK